MCISKTQRKKSHPYKKGDSFAASRVLLVALLQQRADATCDKQQRVPDLLLGHQSDRALAAISDEVLHIAVDSSSVIFCQPSISFLILLAFLSVFIVMYIGPFGKNAYSVNRFK